MSGWLKAGLIGAAIVIVLKVVGLIGAVILPCVGCCAMPLEWVTYGCIGALAAYWMLPVRRMGPAAAQGALAAVIAAVIGGVVGIGVNVVGTAVLGPAQAASVMRQIPPEVLQELVDAGLDPRMFFGAGTGAVDIIACGSVCCGISLAIAAGVGAFGGLIYAGVKPE